MEEGLHSLIQTGIWGKRRGEKKTQGKECLWYWNDFTCIYSKRLETYIDLRRSWCKWRESDQHSMLPSQVWFMPGIWQPLSWETFQNLLVLKEIKCALKKNNKPIPKQTKNSNNPTALSLQNSVHLAMLMSLWCVSRCLFREGGTVFGLFMYNICWLQFWQSVVFLKYNGFVFSFPSFLIFFLLWN